MLNCIRLYFRRLSKSLYTGWHYASKYPKRLNSKRKKLSQAKCPILWPPPYIYVSNGMTDKAQNFRFLKKFPECFMAWCLSKEGEINEFSQYSHLYGFSTLCTLQRCLMRSRFFENDSGHCWHLCGFSPKWTTFVWVFSKCRSLLSKSHNSHFKRTDFGGHLSIYSLQIVDRK